MGRWTLGGGGLFVLFLMFVLQINSGFAQERYTVRSGDSLYKISRSYGISVETLKTVNHLQKENLKLNQVLVIPTSREKEAGSVVQKASGHPTSYVVKKGDNLDGISKKAGLPVEEIKRINQLRTNSLRAGQTLLLSTPKGVIEDSDEEIGDPEETPEEEPEEARAAAPDPSEPSGIWRNSEERSLFIRVVKTFLGVPYRFGGSTLKGIDCSAFVRKIYDIFNIHLPRTTWEQLRIGKLVGKGELEEGDLVFFRALTRRVNNRHVGIYIGNNEFVHASSRTREVRVDSLEAPYFSKRFLNGVRVKELDRES